MLDGADNYPAGSAEWALRLANELNYTVRNVVDFGVTPVIPLVKEVVDHSPWKVWPEGNPAGDIDRFFLYATGYDYQSLHTMIKSYIRDEGLARRLAAAGPTPLQLLHQVWECTSMEDRAAFLREIKDTAEQANGS
jgi:hypothetical protein